MAALDYMMPRATLRAVSDQPADPGETIRSGQAILGIELGSTRIKAALIAPDTTPLAAGSHTWENRFENGLWTYALADVEAGLASSFAALVEDVRTRYAVDLAPVAALGVSGMMHGYIALDADGELPRAVPDVAQQHHRLRRAPS